MGHGGSVIVRCPDLWFRKCPVTLILRHNLEARKNRREYRDTSTKTAANQRVMGSNDGRNGKK